MTDEQPPTDVADRDAAEHEAADRDVAEQKAVRLAKRERLLAEDGDAYPVQVL